ncbi:MAG: sel1 repeat family protein [Methylomicrobium sp.]|nr:sel1 repeat family protein [Methylomicrobium sp.]
MAVTHAEEAAQKTPLKEFAEQGNALAQAQLGALFLLGRDGYEVNLQEAAAWMLKAAEQGLLEAEVVVAAMYDRGLGMPQDVKKATQWYEKAAAKGHGASLAILGKNEAAKGSVAFNYQAVRLKAATQIPNEYAKKILLKTN